ncbi:FAD/NAD(P)-binding protein [Curtobacterium sp. ISL-83]|uniref:FAD/NAD(P)-binding protein n=1 Tax=Curtobacterium sp. ISL-83 TaxID=2819145 RepID=UPI001BE58820|nr:FAD/NAD(P)-binding protein [Curtobacterium sp. ISL-83]MBT2504247.1 FAD/NAD(P)-binding protein [Curtobacterium sp. ISL-83]
MRYSVDLLCIGAGAKATAVAAKAHVLNSRRANPVRVLVVEKQAPAAHWTGQYGYTSGSEHLGTRPEKDIGFPYQSEAAFGPEFAFVDDAMPGLSWHSYLRDAGQYGRWIDRGAPAVSHARFGDYLCWVQERARNGVTHHKSGVARLRLSGDSWETVLEDGTEVTAGSVLLTGPGRMQPLPGSDGLDLPDAASPRSAITSRVIASSHVVVVGGGESAASSARAVLDAIGPCGRVTIVSPGHLRTRSETFQDNDFYTNPEAGWPEKTWDERIDFIRRTDRGVVSPQLLERLAGDDRVAVVAGRVSGVERFLDGYRVTVGGAVLAADLVINCSGFRLAPLLEELLDDRSIALLRDAGPRFDDAALARLIDDDLRLAALPAPLFVPALAGPQAGPGFANLSILGKLADRILLTVLRRDSAAATPAYGTKAIDAVLR